MTLSDLPDVLLLVELIGLQMVQFSFGARPFRLLKCFTRSSCNPVSENSEHHMIQPNTYTEGFWVRMKSYSEAFQGLCFCVEIANIIGYSRLVIK